MSNTTLGRYLARILRFPVLHADEERDLARRWRTQADPRALERLVNSHLRLVVRIARDFKGYGLPVEDLIAAGNLGLLEAARRFDPDRGVRFATCALWWTRAAIQEYVMHNWSLVRIGRTPEQKRLFFGLRRLKRRLRALDEGELAPEQAAHIAQELRVPEAEVIAMDRRLRALDVSLNEPTGEDLDRLDRMADAEADPETRAAEAEERALRRRRLAAALAALDERERRILLARRLKDRPTPLHVLGQEFGVSGERVRQIEARALDKVRRIVRRPDEARAAA